MGKQNLKLFRTFQKKILIKVNSSSTKKMYFLILFNLIFLSSLSATTVAEQLFHREGRFIDLSINKYKTQLPSIHDIANTFIHYRLPVAVFVPTVKLNIRAKQRRTHYASFPTPKKAPSTQPEPETNNKTPVIGEQDAQPKSNQPTKPGKSD